MKREVKNYFEEYQIIRAIALLENNNVDEAIQLLNKFQNNSKAMFNLGLIYEKGTHDQISFKSNYQNALKYYTIAMSLGHSLAHYNLGLIYFYGKGRVKTDRSKGFNLIKKAALLGVEEAKSFVDYFDSEANQNSIPNHYQISQLIAQSSLLSTLPTSK
jgi:PREDICTED: predicted protein-like